MTAPLKLGLVGFGKIARDQHLPAILATEGAELVAIASRHAQADGLPTYPTLEALIEKEPGVEAIAMCQPPQIRYAAARVALAAGRHVFLEKPPGVTVSEVDGGEVRLVLDDSTDSDAILDAARAAGRVTQFVFERRRLSEVFREAVRR